MFQRIIPFMIVLVLLIFHSVAPAAAQLYTVTDLGVGTYEAEGVNNTGFVTGVTSIGYAFKWSPANGTVTNLPVLGARTNVGDIITSNGDIAGSQLINGTASGEIFRGCFWGVAGGNVELNSFVDSGRISAINYNPNFGLDNQNSPYSNNSPVSGMNNNRIAVGLSDTLVSTIVNKLNHIVQGPFQACYWQPAKSANPQRLASFAGIDPAKNQSAAYAINNLGVVAGASSVSNTNLYFHHACVWNMSSPAAAPVDLDSGSSDNSRANCINDLGQVAGIHYSGENSIPCIWTNANGKWQRRDIDPGGYADYNLRKINNSGEIVGGRSLKIGGREIPFLWSPSTRKIKNIQTLVSGWTLTYINDISDAGYMSGTGYVGSDSSQAHGILLRPVVWGARISLTRTSTGQTIKDYLVSLQNGNVTMLSGLFFDTNGNVVADPDTTILATDIASMQLLDNQPDLTKPADMPGKQGFNKYIVQVPAEGDYRAYSETVQLDDNPYNGSMWHYTTNSLNSAASDQLEDGHQTTNLTLTAIPRASGQNNAAARNANITVDAPLLNSFTNAATQYQIPPQILYAIGWHESLEGAKGMRYTGLGWNQFGFITVSSTPGHAKYLDDFVGYERTFVTYDGGIGIMQITAGTAVGAYTGNDLLNHIYNLAGSSDYNIKYGAKILNGKYPWKQIGDNTRNVLEHWYSALWSYNGQSKQSQKQIYSNLIWTALQTGGAGRWSSANTTSISAYFVAAGTDNSGTPLFYPQSGPTLGTGTDTKIAHADANNDGAVDVVVSNPVAVASGNGADISVKVSFASVQSGPVTVSASVDNAAIGNKTNLLLVKKGSDTYTIHVPGVFAKTTTVHFALKFVQGSVTGITYQFNF